MRSLALPVAAAFLVLSGPGCDDDVVPLGSTQPGGGDVDDPVIFVERCASTVAAESEVTPTVLVVLDRSGSMQQPEPAFGSSRWDAVRSAVSSMALAHDDAAAFGLMLFPSPLVADACAAGAVVVNPAEGTGELITSALDPLFIAPGGATPTAATLEQAREALAPLAATAPTTVVLATDGGPNCNPFLDVDTCTCLIPGACDLAQPPPAADVCLDDDATVAAAQALHDAGVSTYVIGVPGSEQFSFVLDEVARVGGTARGGPPGTPDYYPASDGEHLAEALEAVAVRAEKCQRVVDAALDLANAHSIDVTLAGTALARDPERREGFDVIGNKIELFGTACDAAVDGAVVELEVCRLEPEQAQPGGPPLNGMP